MTNGPFSSMPRTLGCILAVLLLPTSLLAQPQKPFADKEPFHPTRIIAKYAARGSAAMKSNALQQQKLKVQRQFKLLPQTVVLDLADESEAKAATALPPQARAKGLRDRIAALQATGLFEYVEPDYVRTPLAEPTDSAFTTAPLGPAEHRPERRHQWRRHRRTGGLGPHHRLDQCHRRHRGHRHPLHPPGPGGANVA